MEAGTLVLIDHLAGKVAVVTGGASGIGASTATRLARLGASVVVSDLDEARGSALADALNARFVAADVSDPSAWDTVIREADHAFGGIDLVHLNAGIPVGQYPVRVESVTDEQYRRVMGVNADGVFFGVRAVVPAMAARGGGAIVVTASVAGLCALPQDPVYAATKHFAVGLVRSLAEPLREHGITINAICPGGVDTPLVDATGPRDAILASGRDLMAPDQVASAVTDLFRGTETGECYSILYTRGKARYEFAEIPGLQR